MKNSILKFGVYSLITALVLFLAGLYFGQDLSFSTQAVIGYASMVVSLIFVFFGIKYYRDKENNGSVSFGKALLIGIVISLFAGVGFAIIDYIYTTSINPDFFENYKAAMIADGYEGEIPNYTSGFMAFIMFATVLVIGFIISLISALILQRKH